MAHIPDNAVTKVVQWKFGSANQLEFSVNGFHVILRICKFDFAVNAECSFVLTGQITQCGCISMISCVKQFQIYVNLFNATSLVVKRLWKGEFKDLLK